MISTLNDNTANKSISHLKTTLALWLRELLSEIKKHTFPSRNTACGKQIKRIEIPINKINLLYWLSIQKNTMKIYWSANNHDFEVAGIGTADSHYGDLTDGYKGILNHLKINLSPEFKNLRYYGGFKFMPDDQYDEQWIDFNEYHFIIPRFEIYKEKQKYFFCCNLMLQNKEKIELEFQSILDQLAEISFDISPSFNPNSIIVSSETLPDREEWKRLVNHVLHLISGDKLKKVVLARKIKIDFSSVQNPYLFLKKLQSANLNTTFFAFQPNEQSCFIGTSPELLYQKDKEYIYSEAIAGTRKRSNNQNIDQDLELDLLRSTKERHEHAIVADYIRKILQELCSQLQMSDQISVLKLNHVQHLFCHFQGKLKNNISDDDIICSLHPTPAIGGYPKKEALNQIKILEPFSRGWYGGPVGWVGHNKSEFALAIRSGLIYNNSLSLYSGAGIVAGSDPDSEWQELETKLSNFFRALHIHPDNSSEMEKQAIKRYNY